MLRHDRPVPGSPDDWLSRARGDLALARAPLPQGAYYEDLCFHAQQAAEKAIKAVYVMNGWAFRYTHDLEDLVAGLKSKGHEIPSDIEEAAILSGFAWEARYPGLMEAISIEEYENAVKLAEGTVRWAERLLGEKG